MTHNGQAFCPANDRDMFHENQVTLLFSYWTFRS
jgi:hypothetical protein